MTRWYLAIALLCGAAAPGLAQQPAAASQPTAAALPLSEAVTLAQRNSPTYRQTLNDAGAARWAVRSAYANTFLPQLSVGGSLGYTGSGEQAFNGTRFEAGSPFYTSAYGVQLDWTLSGQTLTAPGQQKAAQNAVGEDINNALVGLRYEVTFQYLTALQAHAQVDVARQQVSRNGDFLSLAQARFQVGQATILDVKQAEVQKGQADVALLRAQQTENEAKLELFRRMGVTAPVAIDQVALSDSFPVVEPKWELDQLLKVATEENATIRASRAREGSATWNLKAQRSRYLPTLSFSAGWQGFAQQFTNDAFLLNRQLGSAKGLLTNCEFQNSLIQSLPGGGIGGVPGAGTIADCKGFAGLDATGDALNPQLAQAIRSANNVFPFSFTQQPFSARVQISLPIFDGFNRNLQVAQARSQRDDLREQVRGRELQVRTDVQGRFLALNTFYRAIGVQAANREAARDQLRLAQDRYRLGSGSALEISDAQNAVQRAEGDYVNAVYAYHLAIAALEQAVGRPLR
jgi:outer membrane protein